MPRLHPHEQKRKLRISGAGCGENRTPRSNREGRGLITSLDSTHKRAAQIVSCNSMVATEKLSIRNMTRKAKKGKRKRQKAGLNRSILDVGMSMFRKALEYKLAEADGVFIEVPTVTVKPSQTCPNCGYQQKKELSERVHQCSSCAYTADRDVAAAQVMLNWAKGLGTSLSNVDGCSSTSIPSAKNTGGFKQLSQTKRQKPLAQRSG
jgi:putative transposase